MVDWNAFDYENDDFNVDVLPVLWDAYRTWSFADLDTLRKYCWEKMEFFQEEWERCVSEAMGEGYFARDLEEARKNLPEPLFELRREDLGELQRLREPVPLDGQRVIEANLARMQHMWLHMAAESLMQRMIWAGQDVPAWKDLTSNEQEQALDFTRPNRRQIFSVDVQIEALNRMRSLCESGRSVEESMSEVKRWLKENSGHEIGDSTLYEWKDKHGIYW